MYYALTALSLAVSLALSGIVTEIGTKYLARYVVENEISDLGVDPPGAPSANGHPADEHSLMVENSVSDVMPVLMDSIEPSAFLADGKAPEDQAIHSAFRSLEKPSTDGVEVASIGTFPELLKDLDLDAAPAQVRKKTEENAEAKAYAAALTAPENAPLFDLAHDTPHLRDDRTTFLPMATQRIFSLRWEIGRRTEMPMAEEMTGRIVTDPGTGTSVQAKLSGVLEPNNGQFPYIGMRVRKGDPIARLKPIFGISERAQTEARIQQLTNLISLTDKQIRRLEDVLFVRYRTNKIEALKVQRDGYRRELATLQEALGSDHVLRAPASGVISVVNVNVGGTVQQGQTIFEVIDPDALWVEAAAYDPSTVENIRNATARTADGQLLQLEYVGGGLVLKNQAIPLRFRILNPLDGLSVGKPVTVIVQKDEMVSGIPVPADSVLHDGDGRSIVWERVSAETFLAHQVDAVRVSGNLMMVRSGLSDGARIVTEGASILSQIR